MPTAIAAPSPGPRLAAEIFDTIETKIKERLIFPKELRDFVRQRWLRQDSQHVGSGKVVTMDNILEFSWVRAIIATMKKID